MRILRILRILNFYAFLRILKLLTNFIISLIFQCNSIRHAVNIIVRMQSVYHTVLITLMH